MTERLLTAAELAELLSVPETWVRASARSGALPSVVLGRYRRFEREAVLEWLATCRSGGRVVQLRRADRVVSGGDAA